MGSAPAPTPMRAYIFWVVTVWPALERGDWVNGAVSGNPADHLNAWKKQIVLCEHELPGTAKHDPPDHADEMGQGQDLGDPLGRRGSDVPRSDYGDSVHDEPSVPRVGGCEGTPT